MRQPTSAGRLLEASHASGAPGTKKDDWKARLNEILEDASNPLDIVGVGNPLKGDDSVGLHIVSRILSLSGRRPRRNVHVHPPTRSAENVLSHLDSRKSRVLIFDAVAAGGKPGQVILASLADSKFGYFATHNVPLRILPGVGNNPSNVFVAGIEPESLEVGEELSEVVRSSADELSAVVASAFGGGPNGPS
jgi:hydrogenase maturation protease